MDTLIAHYSGFQSICCKAHDSEYIHLKEKMFRCKYCDFEYPNPLPSNTKCRSSVAKQAAANKGSSRIKGEKLVYLGYR